MSAEHFPQTATSDSDNTVPSEKSLGEVLAYIGGLKPQSFHLPSDVSVMKTFGNEAIAGLENGKVVLVTVNPAVAYLLESAEPHTEGVRAVDVSRDQQLAMSGDWGGVVKVWSVPEKRELASFSTGLKWARTVVITPDCKIGIACVSSILKLWSLESMSEIATLEGFDLIKCITVTSDSKLCISGDNEGTIKVWDLNAKTVIATLKGHTGWVSCITLSPDDKTLWSGSRDWTIRAWSLETPQELATFTGHEGEAKYVQLIRNGEVCISIGANTVRLWSVPEKREIAVLEGHSKGVIGLTVFKNEKFCLTCSYDETIKLWDLESYEEILSFTGFYNTIGLTQDNRHFLTSSGSDIAIWSLAERRENRVLTFRDWVYSVVVTEKCAYIANGSDISLWSLKEDRELTVLQGHTSWISKILLTPDQRFLLSASDDYSIKLWDLSTSAEIYSFTGHSRAVLGLAVAPDGSSFLSASDDHTLKLWNIASRSLEESLLHEDIVRNMIVTPDGRHMVSIGDSGHITIWNFPDLKVLATLSGHVGVGCGVDVSPDGRTIVSCGEDKTVRIWSFEERRLLATLYGHSNWVTDVKVSKDGLYAISVGCDCTAKVWSLEERREVACFQDHTDRVKTAAFTPDSNYVITGSGDNTLRITPFQVPWKSSDTALPITSDIVTFVQALKEDSSLKPKRAMTTISPYNVNSLHISAFYNHDKSCQEYLKMGVPFLKSCFGSPLTVSLERRTAKCTDVFLKYLINLTETLENDSEWPTFVCIQEDIPALLRCGSSLVHDFISALMQTPSLPPLPQFITPTSTLPIVQLSDSRLLTLADFDKSAEGEMGSELVHFFIGLIRWNTAPGSTKSLELLDALQDCEDKTVLNTPYVNTLIEVKWEYFYPFTLSMTLLYIAMLSALIMIIFKVWTLGVLAMVFILLNAIFMIYEIAQASVNGFSYWLDPWNLLDVFRGVLCLFWGTLVLRDQELAFLGTDYQRNMRVLVALLCLLRGFTYFRSFRMTRIYVYATLAVVKKMYSFLIIMGYSVFSFGICISILEDHATLGVSWTSAFSLALGEFDTSAFGILEWCIFSGAALINIIIMLNLLVSILGDAFEETQLSVRENDLFLMLEVVREYESMMFWRRNAGTPTILLSCQARHNTEVSGEWAGLTAQLSGKIEEEREKMTKVFEEKHAVMSEDMKEKHKTLETKLQNFESLETGLKILETGQKTLEGTLETKLQTLEGTLGKLEAKMETILSLLQQRS